MEKVYINGVKEKFKGLDDKTKFEMKHDLISRNIVITIEGKEPILIVCPDCEGDKWVIEGMLKRCIKCNSLYI